jgi:hypothetical protein
MATTTNYSWSTPDDTALVKDGASAIRTLGSSVDTTVKALNPETTLGDLAYRSSTANVKTRLGLGTAGQVLQVNSGATAPEWATPSAGSKNFALLNAGGTALTGATTITVSFTAKDALFVRIVGGSSGTTNAIFTMRFNADSGANYPQARWQAEGGSGGTYSLNTNFNGSATSFLIAQIGEVPDAFNSFSYISGAKASGIKTYQGLSDTTNISFTSSYIGNGFYSDSADITSVSIISSAGNFNGGTIYVYGA